MFRVFPLSVAFATAFGSPTLLHFNTSFSSVLWCWRSAVWAALRPDAGGVGTRLVGRGSGPASAVPARPTFAEGGREATPFLSSRRARLLLRRPPKAASFRRGTAARDGGRAPPTADRCPRSALPSRAPSPSGTTRPRSTAFRSQGSPSWTDRPVGAVRSFGHHLGARATVGQERPSEFFAMSCSSTLLAPGANCLKTLLRAATATDGEWDCPLQKMLGDPGRCVASVSRRRA